ncbi:ATP-binding protein [Paraglaciecola chathamensis]|uniref:Histidine kinase/HSP90-like ATPase domain-containing protein n=1 Tax=Paraglaciecola agarilytica NO2 TaxID=1125747 RepID=A0ABQ0ID87_9ALTE|nr:ATP-binding protein [Paraglaciecola agarilytica]GAC07290.1 hypothetical protein GAGA_4465 [Paraglaciecola agarilytica NO2]
MPFILDVKFSIESSPQGSLISLQLTQHGAKHVLNIDNNGPALPKNMQGKLFDSMVSVRSEQATSEPHLGLGLHIAKVIAQFHNAEIQIENQHSESGQPIGVRVSMIF